MNSLALFLAAWLFGQPAIAPVVDYPAARQAAITEEINGVRVTDRYRWMEDLASPETRMWVQAEDRLLKDFVNKNQQRERIKARIQELLHYDQYSAPQLLNPPLIKRGGRYFYIKIKAGESKAALNMRQAGEDQVLLDISGKYPGRDVRLLGFTPSQDGLLVACILSEDQSSWLSVHILSVPSGKELERLHGVHVADPVIAWTQDNSGFFYTAFEKPASGEPAAIKDARLLYHRLRAPQGSDALVYSRPDKPGWLYNYEVTADNGFLVIEARDGSDRRTSVLYKRLRDPSLPVEVLIAPADADYKFLGSIRETFFFFTDLNAPRGRVIAFNLGRSERAHWKQVVAQGADSIAGGSSVGGNAVGMFHGRLVLVYLSDARPVIRVYSTAGKQLHEVALPTGGAIWGGFSGEADDPAVFYQYLGMTDPSTIYKLDVRSGKTSAIFRSRGKFDPERYVTKQVFFTSADGTRVPMFVAHRKGLPLDGSHPAWLYAYGAFGWVSFIWYQPQLLAWLDMGGVYAVPAIRGGGEYGERWHEAGIKKNRQNAVNDYLAAARWLIANKYTTPDRLVANGGSASGTLPLLAAQQELSLFGAILVDRPILDLLRFDKFNAGAYWSPEFGLPSNPEQFRILAAQSPYHRLTEGVCFPPTLVMSGDKDQTASPAHAYKFVARLQAVQSCSHPALLKVMWGAGHNFGATPEQNLDSWTDAVTFLAQALKLQLPQTWEDHSVESRVPATGSRRHLR